MSLPSPTSQVLINLPEYKCESCQTWTTQRNLFMLIGAYQTNLVLNMLYASTCMRVYTCLYKCKSEIFSLGLRFT